MYRTDPRFEQRWPAFAFDTPAPLVDGPHNMPGGGGVRYQGQPVQASAYAMPAQQGPWQGAPQQSAYGLASSYLNGQQSHGGWGRWLKPQQPPVRSYNPYTPPVD